MPGNAAIAAVSAASNGAAPLVSEYGELLKYGASGLAVVILLISFGSLHTFQKTAAEKDVTKDYITRFFWLQCVYVAAAIIMFAIAVFAREPVNNAHRIAFSLSPSLFEKDELVPRLVVAGGAPVAWRPRFPCPAWPGAPKGTRRWVQSPTSSSRVRLPRRRCARSSMA